MKPIDLSKFSKSLTKSMPNISVGFKDPSTWIHTGNYALNYRVSGDFHKGFPLESTTPILSLSPSYAIPKSALFSTTVLESVSRVDKTLGFGW